MIATPIIRRHMSQRNWHLGTGLEARRRSQRSIRGFGDHSSHRPSGRRRAEISKSRTDVIANPRERVKQSIFRSGYGKWIASLRSR